MYLLTQQIGNQNVVIVMVEIDTGDYTTNTNVSILLALIGRTESAEFEGCIRLNHLNLRDAF